MPYSTEPARPKNPVKVLIGLEMLEAGIGCRDEEMHDAFYYRVQVRYVLSYRDWGEGRWFGRVMDEQIGAFQPVDAELVEDR